MTWSQCRGPGALLRLDRRRDAAHRRRAAHAAFHASQAWQQLEHVNVAKVAKLEEAGSEKRSGIGAIYRRTATHWVVSAKREETRERRLAQLIESSAAGRNATPFLPVAARLSPADR
jgi:hypothetical protein